MVKFKLGLAVIAAFGLAVAPAMAETRSGQALPAPSALVDSSAVALASQPMDGESSLRKGGLFGGGAFSPALLIALLAIIAAIIAASSGGGNDSPG